MITRSFPAVLTAPAGTLQVALTWRPSAPFEVVMVMDVCHGSTVVSWVFALDLLIDGLLEPSGIGDIHIRPEGDDTVVVLDSPAGRAELRLPTSEVGWFLAGVWPAPHPSIPDFVDHIDFEAAS